MKKLRIILTAVCLVFVLVSCNFAYRVYNDEDLQDLASSKFNFTEYVVFKIVDPSTAFLMTGTRYQNSGVVIGIRGGKYSFLFVPKQSSEEPFLVMESFTFNLEDVYQDLIELEDDQGNKLYNDPANDYGGLSISVLPYESIQLNNSHLNFDSQIIFTFTTDSHVFHAAYAEGEIVFFDSDNQKID